MKNPFAKNDFDAVTQNYDDAIEYLDNNYAYFLTNVLNIGAPHWTNSIPTAAVALPKLEAKKKATDLSAFEFIFNPKFAESLTPEQFGFVLGHEAMHIVLYHLNLSLTFQNKEIFNIAADCVINDYLDSAGLELIPGICRGEAVVGHNCANSTVTDVYNKIENDPEIMKKLGLDGDCDQCGGSGQGDKDDSKCGGSGESDKDCGDCGGDGKEKDGDGNETGKDCGGCGGSGKEKCDGNCVDGKEPCPNCKGSGKQPGQSGGGFVVIDSHDWMHNPENIKKFKEAMQAGGFKPEDLPDDLEEILTEAQNTYEKTQMAGDGVGAEEYMKEKKVSLKWVELLEKLDPDMFRKPGAGPRPVTSFRTPRRKLAGMHKFSPMILPNMETPEQGPLTKKSDRKPAIVLALDTSGSIGNDTANKFVNLGKSIPLDKVEVFGCTFTTQYRPIDFDNPAWNSGGTCFSCIEGFIRDCVLPHNDGNYPKAVVVVTDGYASFRTMKPTTAQAEGWFWLLIDEYQKGMAAQNLANSKFGFKKENFDTIDGYVDGNVAWHL